MFPGRMTTPRDMRFPLKTIGVWVILLLLVPAGGLSAGSYRWRNVEIGGGGFVTGTVFHPKEPGLVYARTDVGGIYRLDTKTNRWIALNDGIGGLDNEFQHLGVMTIGLDPNDTDRVYIATGQYAGPESWKLPSRVYRSIDRGATWLPFVTPGFKMGGNDEGRGTGERMAVDPVAGNNILVGTSNAGIWRSTDHGETWARLGSFPADLTNLTFLSYASTSHTNPGPNRRVYAGVKTLDGRSFWYSDNNGDTWAEVANHPGKTAGKEMMPLQAAFDAAGVLYTTWGNAPGPNRHANHHGVWKVSANAESWTSIPPPHGQGFFAGIAADPRVAGHVVVTTLLRWWPRDEVYRSTDGGSTWTPVLTTATKSLGNSPWATPKPHWMTDIDIDPFDSNRAIFNTGFGLFQTTNLSGDGTARVWTFFNDGLEETVPHGLLSPTTGPPLVSVIADYTGFRHDHLDRSPKGGIHLPAGGSTSILSGAYLAPGKMIRQNRGSTYFSEDAAATWSAFPTTPQPTIHGHGRVIFSTDGRRLLWCPPNSPAFLSIDHGLTWAPVATAASPVHPSGRPAFTVLAGSAGTPGDENGNGGNTRCDSPGAVALDPTGILHLADTGNHTIRRIDGNGTTTTIAGGSRAPGSNDGKSTAARFNRPEGITVSSDKTVFVADTGNHTIRKISAAGVVTTLAGSAGLAGSTDAVASGARFHSPCGIAIDVEGNVLVCDTGNHTIRRVSPAGEVSTIAGRSGQSGTADGRGQDARFHSPRGIAIDAQGNLFVADTGNHTIRRISSTGDVITFAGYAGAAGSTDGNGSGARFHSPHGIAIDSGGIMHVADAGNHGIRKIHPDRHVITVGGVGDSPGSQAGRLDGRFSSPTGIAVPPNGINLYIADTGNHRILRGYHQNTLIPLADKVDGNRFYLWDGMAKSLLTSTDGGESFSVMASKLNPAFSGFHTVPGHHGHLWALAGNSGLFRSSDFGASFRKIAPVAAAHRLGFGRAKPGNTYPAVFLWGKIGTVVGIFRSDDAGATWIRINDDRHQFGFLNDITGDPRVYGRVYLGTSGRGVIVGDIEDGLPPL